MSSYRPRTEVDPATHNRTPSWRRITLGATFATTALLAAGCAQETSPAQPTTIATEVDAATGESSVESAPMSYLQAEGEILTTVEAKLEGAEPQGTSTNWMVRERLGNDEMSPMVAMSGMALEDDIYTISIGVTTADALVEVQYVVSGNEYAQMVARDENGLPVNATDFLERDDIEPKSITYNDIANQQFGVYMIHDDIVIGENIVTNEHLQPYTSEQVAAMREGVNELLESL